MTTAEQDALNELLRLTAEIRRNVERLIERVSSCPIRASHEVFDREFHREPKQERETQAGAS
jgi:hypothetical protein